jgi:hypothetical protein
MSIDLQLRAMIVLWCATGMFASFMSGYTLEHRDLAEANKQAEVFRRALADQSARNEELRAMVRDRDWLHSELLSCYASTGEYVSAIEDVKWQMRVVVDSCPGRERPPSLPRP